MNTDMELDALNGLTQRVIGCVFKVANTLGPGFLEVVYRNALAHELQKGGFEVAVESPIAVYYDGAVVGEYRADILVEKQVILELKAVKAIDEIHQAQCINYLKATGFRICLLINFGAPKVEIKRLERVVHFLARG